MPFENIVIEIKGRIACLTINREAKLNALNQATLTEISEAITSLCANEAVGGIIITGAGQKAFVAGADIAELSALNAQTAKIFAQEAHTRVFDLIAHAAKPVIAAINGFALGGGLELALACHMRIAAADAKLGLPEVTLGLIPGYGGTQRLTQLAGKGKAMEMILTADMISADDAFKFGIVNYVVPQNDLLPKAQEVINKILLRAPLAVAAAIAAINMAGTTQGFETEISNFANCFNTQDTREGIAAFIEKRKAAFKGR